MDPAVWITALVLAGLVVVLVRELVPVPAAMTGALVTLVLAGVAEPADAFVGFSSTATIAVAGLFVVALALRVHGGIDGLVERGLDGVTGDRAVLARLCVPVAALSSVVANTPLVAGLAPVVRTWSERAGRSPSRVLLPLSFAAIIGGVATTIGTSTTLVASGVIAAETGQPFGLLEVTPLGLPYAVVATVALILLAPRLVPDRGDTWSDPAERTYSCRMVVVPGGALDGRTLRAAGLRQLDRVFVAAIDRGPAGVAAARPDSRLAGGDVLVLVGDAEGVVDVPVEGLRHADEHQVAALDDDRVGLHEVVVGRGSTLAGRTLKQLSFRGRYGGAVLAIARAGERVEGKLGTVTLQVGDALLVRAAPGFADRWRDAGDFAVVVPIGDQAPVPSSRRLLVVAITIAMVAVAATGLLSLVEAVLWACALLVATRTVTFRQALEALDLDVLLIIASAIGIGSIVDSSGVAGLIADATTRLADGTTVVVALAALLLGTTLLTEVVTNVASAALMVPIALRTAEALGEDPRGWAVAVALSASTSFLTPVGYQTNTIVFGLGGYRFGDYWRLGTPLVALWIVVAVVLTPIVW